MPYSRSSLKTVDHALQVLLKFDGTHREWSCSELSEAVNLHRSIVYRILTTLEQRGFVKRGDRRGRFRLDTKLIELGNVVLMDIDLREVARPYMARLVEETGESAFLTVLDGDEALGVESVDSPQPIRVCFSIGGHYPLYAGSANKVILAYLPPEQIDRVIAKGLKALTSNTVTDPVQLKQDLAIIRQQGWSFTIGEMVPDVAGVAAPIWNSNHFVIASLNVTGPSSRFGEDKLPRLIGLTQQAASDISKRLLTWRKAGLPAGNSR